MSPQIFHLPKLTVWNYFELLYSSSHKRHIKIILEMHKLDINHTKICLKLAQMHGYDDLWAKSMKNLLLTAFNPSLVWWLLLIQELLLNWLGTALHMWQGPCQGWITTRLKTRGIFQMKLVFWRSNGWASKAIVKVHWTGTAKNSSGDTVVSNSAKTIAIRAQGTELVRSKINFLGATISWKNVQKFLQTTDFFLKYLPWNFGLFGLGLSWPNAKIHYCPW